jgi:RimJ/RimL family protein N-acetyltransferase
VRTARVELRLPTDDEIRELMALAGRGIHPPEQMPFRFPWSDRTGEELVRGGIEHHHEGWASWLPELWSLNLAVFVEGRPAGAQSVRGNRFAETREFETGSWLGREYQGRGLGTEMREGVLAFGFRGLGAEKAISGAFDFNSASLRVSEKLGYRLVGEGSYAPRGEPQRELIVELTRDEWEARVHPAVEFVGLESCLPLFGL